MRTFFSFLCVCLVAGSAMAQQKASVRNQKFPFTARVVADRVNVRCGQSHNYESVAVLRRDSEVVVLGKSYSWYKVALPAATRLFMKAEYVKLLSPEIGEVMADRVNVRSRPGTQATIMAQLLRGEKFFIIAATGENSEWHVIRPVPGAFGWVQEDFLELKSASVTREAVEDPSEVLTRIKAAQEVSARGRAEKVSSLKEVAQGLYEAEGVLVPVAGLEGAGYKLVAAPGSDVALVYVRGAVSMLESFSGEKVLLRGTRQDEAGLDIPVLAATRISLSL